jgi:phage gpG-like protein
MIQLDVINIERTIRGIRAVGDRLDDLRIPFSYLARDFEKIMERNFRSEGQYSGTPWAPLSPKWAAYKRKKGKDHGILQFNRTLMESLTRSNARGAVRTVRSDEMILGTRIPYGEFHVTGTRRMPRRNFLRIPLWDRQRWVKILEHYVVHGTL